MNQPVVLDIARANDTLGVVLRLSEEQDREPEDRRPAHAKCPTCDEGVLTITNPKRCRECTAEGL